MDRYKSEKSNEAREEADDSFDVDREVEALRASSAFQAFLDERSACQGCISLEEIEQQLNEMEP